MSARRRTLSLVAAACSVALLAAVAIVLTQSEPHRTGTTGHPRALAPALPPGASICQAGQDIYPGTGRIGVHAEGAGGPLEVTVLTGPDEALARGRTGRGPFHPWERTVARIPEIERTLRNATVCFHNAGDGGVRIYGQRVREPTPAATLPPEVEQPPGLIALRIDYLEPDARSWWSFAPTVADRFGLVKATVFGAWTLWAVGAALLALALGAIWYTARAVGRA